WLRTLTQNAWSDFLQEQRGRAGGGPAGEDILQTLEARDDLGRRLEEAFDQDGLAQARDQVKARGERRTWPAVGRTAGEGVPAAEVAGRLGLRVGAVYQARSHVQKLLREAVAHLSGEE